MATLYIPPCEVLQPQTLDEALHHLSRFASETKIIAGGTDLIPSMRYRLFEPGYLLSLRNIRELNGIREDKDFLTIGATTSLRTLETHPLIHERYPVLLSAIRAIAAPNIRVLGTLGGNICLDTRCQWYNQSFFWRKGNGFCLKKDGSRCHVAPGGKKCWAMASADSPAVLLPMDAELRIVSTRGERKVSLKEFYVFDGKRKFNLQDDEIVAEIRIPRSAEAFEGRYWKYRIRKSVDYPLVGVAVLVKKGKEPDVRIGLTAVGPSPLEFRVPHEWWFEPITVVIERIAQKAYALAKPLTTTLQVPPDYRKHLVRVFVRRILGELFEVPLTPILPVAG